jgi:hypothetical protein
MTKDKRRQLKVHLVFAGGVTLILLFGVLSKMASGERFFQALWNSVKDGRPTEWLMILLFWYMCAFQRPQNSWTTGQVTTLGLSGRE